MAVPHLNASPLLEVVYSLSAFNSSKAKKEDTLARLEERLERDNRIESLDQVQVRVRTGAAGKTTQERGSEWAGAKAVSKDGKRVSHFMREGFFMSFLAPYPGFEACIPLVKENWELYQELFGPDVMVRAGMRYINQFSILLEDGQVDFTEHFRFLAQYPIDGAFTLHRFHHQFELTEEEFNLPARVIFRSVRETSAELQLVLDIETYEAAQRKPSDEGIWESFDSLHRLAYKLFKNTLTEQCLNRFQ